MERMKGLRENIPLELLLGTLSEVAAWDWIWVWRNVRSCSHWSNERVDCWVGQIGWFGVELGEKGWDISPPNCETLCTDRWLPNPASAAAKPCPLPQGKPGRKPWSWKHLSTVCLFLLQWVQNSFSHTLCPWVKPWATLSKSAGYSLINEGGTRDPSWYPIERWRSSWMTSDKRKNLWKWRKMIQTKKVWPQLCKGII